MWKTGGCWPEPGSGEQGEAGERHGGSGHEVPTAEVYRSASMTRTAKSTLLKGGMM